MHMTTSSRQASRLLTPPRVGWPSFQSAPQCSPRSLVEDGHVLLFHVLAVCIGIGMWGVCILEHESAVVDRVLCVWGHSRKLIWGPRYYALCLIIQLIHLTTNCPTQHYWENKTVEYTEYGLQQDNEEPCKHYSLGGGSGGWIPPYLNITKNYGHRLKPLHPHRIVKLPDYW